MQLVHFFEKVLVGIVERFLKIFPVVVIVEVLLGVMLLLGFKPKFTVWSLLAMIVFFTFLTFYSAYFNKVTDCGCFGDAIKLTPPTLFLELGQIKDREKGEM